MKPSHAGFRMEAGGRAAAATPSSRCDPMSSKPYNVLFICTGNSARSILAQALLDHLGRGRFHAYSAGSAPKGSVNPGALRMLSARGLSVDGLRSKSWDEFAEPGAPAMDFVFTVCDDAAGEVCPVWPGQPMTAHWGLPDPAAVQGDEAAIDRAFQDAFVTLKRRVELMLALPIDKLDRLSLQHRVKDIGTA